VSLVQEIEIDLGYTPREAFVPYHERKQRWSVVVAHRRAGKTVACIMDLIDAAMQCKKQNGRFAYVAPTYAQSKDVAWAYLKQFSVPIVGTDPHETELRVDLPNGHRIRLYGADNYDRLRGLYLDGVVLDEFADMDPRAWSEVIRPALSDRQGWATFIGTPKGRNAFYRMLHGDSNTGWEGAHTDPDWFSLILKASETGILPKAELDDARRMMTEEQYRQEYECDFNAALIGAYYGKDLAEAEKDKRIASVPYDKAFDVHASWDLGIGDSTAIWVGQLVGREIRFIDYIESSGVGLDWYVGELKSKPYKIVEHFVPHDAEARELTTGKTRLEYLTGRELNCRVVPRHKVQDRINATRMAFNRCWFDAKKCERGLEALRMYQEKRDEKRDVALGPLHDWTSHAADSFGYFVMALNEQRGTGFNRKIEYPSLGLA
jgi:phage terminase large subunit